MQSSSSSFSSSSSSSSSWPSFEAFRNEISTDTDIDEFEIDAFYDNLIEQLSLDPSTLKSEVDQIAMQMDSHISIKNLLRKLIEHNSKDSEIYPAMSRSICEVICRLSPEIMTDLLQENHLILFEWVDYLGDDQGSCVIDFIASKMFHWKIYFKNTLEAFFYRTTVDEYGEGDAERFIHIILRSLNPDRQEEWIEYSSYLDYPAWAFMMIILKEDKRRVGLNAATQYLDFDLSKNGVFNYVESISAYVNDYPQDVKEILAQIIKQFVQAKEFDRGIVQQWGQINAYSRIQACLLNAMTVQQQANVLRSNSSDATFLACWLDQLLSFSTKVIEMRLWIARFSKVLSTEQISYFVNTLIARKSQYGASLIAFLPDGLFSAFTLNFDFITNKQRTNLLVQSGFHSSSVELLRSLKENINRREIIYHTMSLDMDTPEVPTDPDFPLTLFRCFSVLEQLHSDADTLQNYSSFIRRIPPFLIGLLAFDADKTTTLAKIAPFMNEEQIKFFVSSMSGAQFYAYEQGEGAKLSQFSYLAALKGLSPQGFLEYVQLKVEDLKSFSEEFRKQEKQINEAFEEYKKNDELLLAHYKELEDRVCRLHLLSRKPRSLQYHSLWNFLSKLESIQGVTEDNLRQLESEKETFESYKEYLLSKRILFEGAHPLMLHHLDEIKKRVKNLEEEIDLTQILYEGFWTLMRDGVLPYLGISPHSSLGITHPGELTFLGIRSNRDLELLGVSAARQNLIDRLINQIESLKFVGFSIDEMAGEINESHKEASLKRVLSEFQMEWFECIKISLDKKESDCICWKMVEKLDISKMADSDMEVIKQKMVLMANEILVLEHLTRSEKTSIQEKAKRLQQMKQARKVKSFAPEFIFEIIIILRNQHPLFCLQRYLTANTNLKSTWEKLRERKYSSLSSLIDNGLIGEVKDCLNLQKLSSVLASS